MAELNGMVCLETIVEQINNDLFNGSRGHYYQILQWVIRGAMKLNMHILINKKVTKEVVLDEPYCLVLPNDYVRFQAIGISKHGKFVAFHNSHYRTVATTESCGLEIQNTDEAQPTPTEAIQNRLTYYPTYTYTLDEPNNRILIDGFPKLTEVVLIYQSTGINTGKATYIPIKAQEALIAWVHLQIASHTSKSSFDYNTALQRYQMEVALLGKMQISIKNLYEVAREVYMRKMSS